MDTSQTHPMASTYLAMWISPAFAIKVSKWIEEWRLFDIKNNTNFIKELCVLEPYICDNQEKIIQLKLAKKLNADIEVKTPIGRIDLLSADSIIEIKEFSMWKSALGQILSYGSFYPLKAKKIYLFGDIKEDKIEIIKDIFKAYNVELIIYE